MHCAKNSTVVDEMVFFMGALASEPVFFTSFSESGALAMTAARKLSSVESKTDFSF